MQSVVNMGEKIIGRNVVRKGRKVGALAEKGFLSFGPWQEAAGGVWFHVAPVNSLQPLGLGQLIFPTGQILLSMYLLEEACITQLSSLDLSNWDISQDSHYWRSRSDPWFHLKQFKHRFTLTHIALTQKERKSQALSMLSLTQHKTDNEK